MSNTVVRTNVMALNSHRNLGLVSNNQQRASSRLSSGFRINSAADDAAGLGISEKMRAQIRGLDQASRNGQDGISLIQTAEGAMSTVNEMVTRIRELVVQAANDTNAHDASTAANWALSDRTRIQDEINQLMDEIDATRNRVEFNTRTLLNGSLNGNASVAGATGGSGAGGSWEGPALWFHVGANSNQGVHLEIADIGTEALANVTGAVAAVNTAVTDAIARNGSQLDAALTGAEFTFDMLRSALPGETHSFDINGLADFERGTAFEATGGVLRASGEEINLFLTAIDMALSHVTAERSNLGAMQNRLEYTIENLDIASENLSAAESRIRDADMALEMMRLTQANVLQQAATSMLAQANQAPQSVLQLLG
jgi:flagellin